MHQLIDTLEERIKELITKFNEQKENVSSLEQEIEHLKIENEKLNAENIDLKSNNSKVDEFKSEVETRLLSVIDKLDNLENS